GWADYWTVRGPAPAEHRVPGPDDDAVINRPGRTITVSQDHDVRSLRASTNLVFVGGTFSVAADSSLGNLDLRDAATLQVRDGTTTLVAGGMIAGSFAVASATGGLELNGGRFDFVSAATRFDGPGAYRAARGTPRSAGQFHVDFVDLTAPQNFHLAGGSITGSRTLTVPAGGVLTWTGGEMVGPGATEIAEGAHLDVSGTGDH